MSKALVRMLYPRASSVIAVSDGVVHDLHANFGVPAEKLVSIPNPVDLTGVSAMAQHAAEIRVPGPYVVTAGRLVSVKRFDLLIRAFAAAGDSRTLVIIGEGEERAALERVAKDTGVAERVVFTGFLANPYALMAGAELFVLASESEGYPNALVEAMALGIPVVATDCRSGPSEILAEKPAGGVRGVAFEAHGVLVPPNDEAAMTLALREMIGSGRLPAYGERAAQRAKSFDAAAAAERYWAVLRKAAQISRSARENHAPGDPAIAE